MNDVAAVTGCHVKSINGRSRARTALFYERTEASGFQSSHETENSDVC